jgi:S1-C subfamily serine protease
MNAFLQRCTATVLAGTLVGFLSAAARAAEPGADYQVFLTSKAPVLVTVKFVLKMKGGFMDEREDEGEATGVMIDPHGLVLCSNTQLGGLVSLFSRFGAGNISITPTDIKVLVGDDTEGVDADILARDTELDLAWIQIKEPAEAGYTHLDLTQAAKPGIGDRVLCVKRMSKFFDRVPSVLEGRIAGLTRKPRELYVPSSELASGLGMPVYLPDGKVVGILVTQTPDPEEMELSRGSFFTNPFSVQDLFSGLILPADRVVKATQRAHESAKEEAAKATTTESEPEQSAAPKDDEDEEEAEPDDE